MASVLHNILINVGWLIASVGYIYCAYRLGKLVRTKFNVFSFAALEAFLIDVALGWVLIGSAIYLLGLLNGVYRNGLLVSTVGFLLWALFTQDWKRLRSFSIRQAFRSLHIIGKLAIIVGAIFVVLNLLGVFAPDTNFDSTWYHLPEAKLALVEHDTRVHWPSMLDKSSIAPRLPEMLFTWSLAPYPDLPTLPQLLELYAGIGLALATVAIARRFTKLEYALVAGIIVYSVKDMAWLSQAAYVDLIQAYIGAVAVIALLPMGQEKAVNKLGYRFLGALLIGGFLASKMQSLVFLPALALVISANYWPAKVRTSGWVRELILDEFWILGGAFLLVAPWYIEIWHATGNPLFTLERPPGDDTLGGSTSLLGWLLTRYPTTVLPTVFTTFSQNAPLFLLGLFPLLWWRQLSLVARAVILSGLIALLGWTLIPVPLIRYGFFVLPFLAAGVGYLLEINAVMRNILLLVSTIIIGLNALMALNLVWQRAPVAYGRVSQHGYLETTLRDNMWIYYDTDGQVAKIVGSSRVATLIHNPYYVDVNSVDAVRLKQETNGSNSVTDILTLWKKDGVSYLLAHRTFTLHDFFDQTQLPGGTTGLSQEAIHQADQAVSLVYQNADGVKLWRIK